MKRDMDLVRAILLALEEHPKGYAPDDIELEGYSKEQIGYHAYLMMQGGLIEGLDVTTRGRSSPEAVIRALTWSGHEFIEAAREPSRWEQAKGMLDKAGGAAFNVWVSVLSNLVSKNLGIS